MSLFCFSPVNPNFSFIFLLSGTSLLSVVALFLMDFKDSGLFASLDFPAQNVRECVSVCVKPFMCGGRTIFTVQTIGRI